jgi:hypothetical protein
MPPDRRDASASRRTVDADGVVRLEQGGSGWLLWTALLLVGAAVAWLAVDLWRAPEEDERGPGLEAAPARAAVEETETAPRSAQAAPVAMRMRAAPEVEPADQPSEIYVNQIDPGPGERTGIHAFPPPGTKPIKGGILVPEGYQLPPGYVRHYQSTDDGEPVQAILLFHPDHQPRDAAGRPIPMPADRVVPPELAPPGMPVVVLEPPAVRRDWDQTSAPRARARDWDQTSAPR